MKKTITITNRDLVRRFRFYRDQLTSGVVTKIIIPIKGKKITVSLDNQKGAGPGDIRPLLEKLKKGPGYNIVRPKFRNNLRTI